MNLNAKQSSPNILDYTSTISQSKVGFYSFTPIQFLYRLDLSFISFSTSLFCVFVLFCFCCEIHTLPGHPPTSEHLPGELYLQNEFTCRLHYHPTVFSDSMSVIPTLESKQV